MPNEVPTPSAPPKLPSLQSLRSRLAVLARQKKVRIIAGLLAVVLLVIFVGLSRKPPVQTSLPTQTDTAAIAERLASLQPLPAADITADHEYYDAVRYLTRYDILATDSAGNFNPDQTLTRAEWAVLLVKLTGLELDPNQYRCSFSDLSSAPSDSQTAICYTSAQGWVETSREDLTHVLGLKTALADEPPTTFSPNEPINSQQAVGSLGRMMGWASGKPGLNDNEAIQLAHELNLFQVSGDSVSKGEAAELVFESLATVPFAEAKYRPELNHVVEVYRPATLWDAPLPVDNPQDYEGQGWENNKGVMAQIFAQDNGIGLEAAQRIVDASSSYAEARQELRLYRQQTNWLIEQAGLDSSQAFTEANLLTAVQDLLNKRGSQFTLTAQDVLMFRKSLGTDELFLQPTTDPTFRQGEKLRLLLVLDENFQVLTRDQWNNGQHVLGVEAADYYIDSAGSLFGEVFTELYDMQSGQVKEFGASLSDNFDTGLSTMFDDALLDLELDLGSSLTPPVGTATTDTAATGDFPRLYYLDESRHLLQDQELCPFALFFEDDNILVCGQETDADQLYSVVRQWRSGLILGPDGRYNTSDGQRADDSEYSPPEFETDICRRPGCQRTCFDKKFAEFSVWQVHTLGVDYDYVLNAFRDTLFREYNDFLTDEDRQAWGSFNDFALPCLAEFDVLISSGSADGIADPSQDSSLKAREDEYGTHVYDVAVPKADTPFTVPR